MRYLFAASQSDERLGLLLSTTKISSEDIKTALRDHLVRGFDVKNAAAINGVAQQNLDRALNKLEEMAQVFEKVKDHDARKYSAKWCKCHEANEDK